MAWWQISVASNLLLLHLFPQKQMFTCVCWLLHGPTFKVRLQRTFFVSDPGGVAYFSHLHITALAIWRFIFTPFLQQTWYFSCFFHLSLSLAHFAIYQISSVLTTSFWHCRIHVKIVSICKSILSCFLLHCLLTLSLLFHSAISKYLQPMFCHHQTVCFWIQFQN